MTESHDARDEVVARALSELPVPDHGPTFWAELDRALAAPEQSSPTPSDDARPPRLDTGELPAVTSLAQERPRRRRKAPVIAVAAAAAVLVVAVSLVTLSGGDDDGDELADESTSPTTLAEVPSPDEAEPELATETTATTEPTESPAGGATPEATAVLWVDSLSSGDYDTAAALLGPRSLSYLEGINVDPVDFIEGSASEYVSWADAPDVQVRTEVIGQQSLLGPSSQLAVVTLAATEPVDGESSVRQAAIPLVDDGDGWRVEYRAFNPAEGNPNVVFTVPALGSSDLLEMAPDDDVNVFVPAMGMVYFGIDGGEMSTRATTLVGREPEPFALHNPPGDLSPGPHQLLVVAVGEDGTIAHFAGTFAVTG